MVFLDSQLSNFSRMVLRPPEDYSGGREAADIIEFFNKQAGTRARINKPSSAVTILTPENFDSIVLDDTKDVLVEFFAPWCGHCKKIAPIWEKLASAFRTEESVVIASVDADQYKELGTKHGVSGFPTLIYYPKTNKNGDRYNGGRELPDLLAYVNKEAGTKRLESGRYDETVGRHDTLDELAKKFISASEHAREAIVSEVEKEAASLGEHAAWYGKFMRVVLKKGIDWIEKEKSRVEGLLEGGAISGEKHDEFTVRQNVLKAFE